MATLLDKDETVTLLRPDVTPDAVIEQLDRIMRSEPFRNSKRHPRFLRFVVGKLLDRSADEIKERLIGIEVFDRAADYDASSDPIVRVAAGEIRKRLAQYYLVPAHSAELRFELQVGSYLPTIYWPDGLEKQAVGVAAQVANPTPEDPKENDHKEIAPIMGALHRRLWPVVAACLLIFAAIVVGAVHYTTNPERNLNAFWKPMLDSGVATLCVGDLNYLMPASDADNQASLSQVMRGRNHLGQANTTALVKLASNLGSRGVTSSVLLADTANLTDLRGQPSVLIGAFDNRWTDKILNNTRFRVVWNTDSHKSEIVDSEHPDKTDWQVDFGLPINAINRDYAVVARIVSPLTGQATVVLAGVGPYGTIAASEFVTNPQYFKQFADKAPRGWQNHNVEIVISTQVVDGRSAAPVVLAYDVR